MLSPKLKPGVFVVMLAVVVAAAVTLVMTLLSHRLSFAMLDVWGRSLLIGTVVAVPVALLAAGPLRRASEWMCR